MKAQTSTVQIAALGGIAAGVIFFAARHYRADQPSVEHAVLNQRIRAGILSFDEASRQFADRACYISEARWLLSAEPFSQWKVAWMGLSRPVIFDKKYQHGYVIVYDKERKPFMAIHTMPNDRSADPLPNAMGDRNCVIDIFPVTMDASDALCGKRGHDDVRSPELIPLQNPRLAAARLFGYMQAVHNASLPYTVPVKPVKNELLAALRDDLTLDDFPDEKRSHAVARRARAAAWIEGRSDASLARWLNPATKYRLGATGFNSNSGAADIMTLLCNKHSFDLIKAPFCDQSMRNFIAEKAALNLAGIETRHPTPSRAREWHFGLPSATPAFA